MLNRNPWMIPILAAVVVAFGMTFSLEMTGEGLTMAEFVLSLLFLSVFFYGFTVVSYMAGKMDGTEEVKKQVTVGNRD